MPLTDFFVDHYLHGAPLLPEQASEAGYDYVWWKGRLVLRARKTGVYTLPFAFHLIDWDESCGPCNVLYHYTNEAGFMGIARGGGHEMVMRCSIDANADAYFGKGLYGTHLHPASERWTSKKDIQFNNYWPRATAGGKGLSSEGLLLYDQLRRQPDFPYDHAEQFCKLELAHFNDRVDFCIPVLVNEAKGRKLMKADAINAYSETGPQWRDVWILKGGQHPPGEYRCSMTHLLKVARLQIILATQIEPFYRQLKLSGLQMLVQVKRSRRALDLRDSMVEEAIAALNEFAVSDGEDQEYFWQAYEIIFNHISGTNPNYRKAHRLAQKAADLGSADGKALLGLSYVLGEGVAKDSPRGASLIRGAAAEGSAFGTTCLGLCHLFGHGMPQNRDMARDLFLEASMRDDACGKHWYAWLVIRQRYCVPEDMRLFYDFGWGRSNLPNALCFEGMPFTVKGLLGEIGRALAVVVGFHPV